MFSRLRVVLAVVMAVSACSRDSSSSGRSYAALLDEPAPTPASQAVAAHTAFRRWLDGFKKAVPAEQERLRPAGELLAMSRREQLRGIMVSEPELALSMALSMAERRMLPPEIAQHVERWRDGRGSLHVVGAVDEAPTPSPLRPKPVERFVTFDGRDTVLRAGVYGARERLPTMNDLRLHGIELDGVFSLFELPARRLRPEDVGFFDYQPGSPCPTSRRASTANDVIHDGDSAVGFCQPLHADAYTAALGDQETTAATEQLADSAWTEGPKTVLFMRVDFDDRPGEPLSLASALVKISGAAHHIENDTAEANPATAHLFIINPLSGQRMDNLFSTHPDTQNRIAALERIAGEMGVSARRAPPPRPSAAPRTGPWG